MFACIFAFLPNKNVVTYNQFLIEVRNTLTQLGNEHSNILMELEKVAMNAAINDMPSFQS